MAKALVAGLSCLFTNGVVLPALPVLVVHVSVIVLRLLPGVDVALTAPTTLPISLLFFSNNGKIIELLTLLQSSISEPSKLTKSQWSPWEVTAPRLEGRESSDPVGVEYCSNKFCKSRVNCKRQPPISCFICV